MAVCTFPCQLAGFRRVRVTILNDEVGVSLHGRFNDSIFILFMGICIWVLRLHVHELARGAMRGPVP